MSETLISGYFKRKLAPLGYPIDDVRCALDSCQGKGLAFYGEPDLKPLSERLMPDLHRHVMSAVEKGCKLKLTKNQSLHMYDHENTMDIEEESWAINEDLSLFEEAAWEVFCDEVKAEVPVISKQLWDEAWEIAYSGPHEEVVARTFTTQQYIFQVIECPDEDFDLELFDEDYIMPQYEALIKGSVKVLGVKVAILDAEDESVLVEDSLWGIICAKDDPTYGHTLREIFRNAVAKLKEQLIASRIAA